ALPIGSGGAVSFLALADLRPRSPSLADSSRCRPRARRAIPTRSDRLHRRRLGRGDRRSLLPALRPCGGARVTLPLRPAKPVYVAAKSTGSVFSPINN